LIESVSVEGVTLLRKRIEQRQERLVRQLHSIGYRMAGSYLKQIVTKIGRVCFRVKKLWKPGMSGIVSPILDALHIRRIRYARDVRMLCVDLASRLSYGDAKKEVKKTNGLEIPKRTIHSFVQEIAPKLKKANEHAVQQEGLQLVVMADGTKVRSIYDTDNDVQVAIAYNPEGGSKTLLQASVNKPWNRMEGFHILVCDADRSTMLNLGCEETAIQLDIVHAVKETLIKLWSEGMSKEERDKVSLEMKSILYTLVNSTMRHGLDGDIDALNLRIDQTLKELNKLSEKLLREGYPKASHFIRKDAKLMVTFAKLLTLGVKIPYTSNAIERLMGEVMKRCKHKWAHWSTQGLENILQIILTRYTREETYEAFWKTYIHPSQQL